VKVFARAAAEPPSSTMPGAKGGPDRTFREHGGEIFRPGGVPHRLPAMGQAASSKVGDRSGRVVDVVENTPVPLATRIAIVTRDRQAGLSEGACHAG